ncbi:cytochrome c oxidase subunit 2 [Datura stramonium]|uniref:Cytochrome c oxidase subunit 2 n=1 Tax=Datura stramonium TaxID=4076 RepID=A0ABS8TFQ4_DATST|nr:cytochrome c oxidase subunit 2 [Datura stramonium]
MGSNLVADSSDDGYVLNLVSGTSPISYLLEKRLNSCEPLISWRTAGEARRDLKAIANNHLKQRASKLVWKNCCAAGNPSLYKFSDEGLASLSSAQPIQGVALFLSATSGLCSGRHTYMSYLERLGRRDFAKDGLSVREEGLFPFSFHCSTRFALQGREGIRAGRKRRRSSYGHKELALPA